VRDALGASTHTIFWPLLAAVCVPDDRLSCGVEGSCEFKLRLVGMPADKLRKRHGLGGMSIFRDKRILVTGGAGFLGSSMRALLKVGAEVLCVDNYLRDAATSPTFLAIPCSRPFVTMSRFPLCGSRRILTSRVPPRRCTISMTQLPPQSQRAGAINALGLAKRLRCQFCRLRPAKSTVTRLAIPNPGPTGDMSIRLVRAACYDEGKRCVGLLFDYGGSSLQSR
jgi:hypothetical protein